jgi:hypothetical protein
MCHFYSTIREKRDEIKQPYGEYAAELFWIPHLAEILKITSTIDSRSP